MSYRKVVAEESSISEEPSKPSSNLDTFIEENGIFAQGKTTNRDDDPIYNVDAAVHSLIAGMEDDDADSLFPHQPTGVARVAKESERESFVKKGGVWADGEEDVEQLAAVSQMTKRRRKPIADILCHYFPCILLLAIFIALGSLLIHDARTTQAEKKTTNEGGSTQMVSPPPEDLSTRCSQNYAQELGNGWGPCESACDPGQCCHHADKHKNCFLNNVETCDLYAECLILKDVISSQQTIPDLSRLPPPDNIAEICTSEAITQSAGACVQACEPSLCCFSTETTDSCYKYKDNDVVCDEYQVHCSLLGAAYGGFGPGVDYSTGGADGTLGEAPIDLEYWCSGNAMDTCTQVCEQAKCCIETGDLQCTSALETCVTYIYCDKVIPDFDKLMLEVATTFGTDAPTNGIVPAPPEELKVACDKADGDYASLAIICDSMCLPVSECCVTDDASANCFQNNPVTCAMYAPCVAVDPRYEQLNSIDTGVDTGGWSDNHLELPLGPISLEYWCSGEDMDRCEEVCEVAKCCIGQGEFDCQSELETCVTYIYCDAVIPEFDEVFTDAANKYGTTKPVDGIVPAPRDELKIACDEADGDYASMAVVCDSLCLPVSDCCVSSDPAENCRAKNPETCPMYDPCVAIDPRYGPTGTYVAGGDTLTNGSSGSSPIELHYAPISLEFWCDGDGENMDKCQQTCETARCCVDSGSQSCQFGLDTCVTYMYCAVVIPEFDALEAQVTDRFGSVVTTDGVVPAPPPELASECEMTDGDYPSLGVICAARCSPVADCCVDPDPSRNCYNDNVETCLQYAPCVAVDPRFETIGDTGDSYSGSTGTNPVDSPTGSAKLDIKRVCNFLYFENDPESEDECRVTCDIASCCIVDDEAESCLMSNADLCSAYAPCISVNPDFLKINPKPYDTLAEPVASDLAAACSTDGISTPAGVEECQQLCDVALCCVNPVAGASCLGEYVETCQMYAPCAAVFPQFGFLGAAVTPP